METTRNYRIHWSHPDVIPVIDICHSVAEAIDLITQLDKIPGVSLLNVEYHEGNPRLTDAPKPTPDYGDGDRGLIILDRSKFKVKNEQLISRRI